MILSKHKSDHISIHLKIIQPILLFPEKSKLFSKTVNIWLGLPHAIVFYTHIELLTCAHASKSLQLCLTFCSPTDCSTPGCSVQGILQARILECVAMPSSRGSPRPRDQTHVSYISCIDWQTGSIPLASPGKQFPQ